MQIGEGQSMRYEAEQSRPSRSRARQSRKRNAESHQQQNRSGAGWVAAILLILAAGAASFTCRYMLLKQGSQYEVALQTEYQVITDSCNIRAGAGTAYEVVGTAQKGDVLSSAGTAVLNESGTLWYEIMMENGENGWVSETVISEK